MDDDDDYDYLKNMVACSAEVRRFCKVVSQNSQVTYINRFYFSFLTFLNSRYYVGSTFL
jgi:hypothetical protein